MARANGVPEWRLQYDIDFESVVRGDTTFIKHCGSHVCKKDDRKEAALYDENAIGVSSSLRSIRSQNLFSSDIHLSFLMHSFLKSRDDNRLIAEVIGARKRENGLVVPCVYHGRSASFQVAKILKKQLIKASALYKHMKIEVSGTAIIKKACFEQNRV